MCQRCENDYYHIVGFFDNVCRDDSLSEDEVEDKIEDYVREHQLFCIDAQSYLLGFDSSIIVYDWEECDFYQGTKNSFKYCPYCGRKL